MQNPNPVDPDTSDVDYPKIPDEPIGDDPESLPQEEIKVTNSEEESVSEDESMPGQSGGSQSKGGETGGGGDTGVNKFQTNVKHYGGKPPGDESIANRGVTNANANKDKTI